MHDALRLPQRHECFCQTTRFDRWPLQHVTRLVAEIRYLDNTLALSHVIFRSLSLKLRGNTMPFSENYIVGSEPLGTFEQATRCERRRDTFSTALGPPTKRNNGSTFSRSILLVTAGKTCARRGNSVTTLQAFQKPTTKSIPRLSTIWTVRECLNYAGKLIQIWYSELTYLARKLFQPLSIYDEKRYLLGFTPT